MERREARRDVLLEAAVRCIRREGSDASMEDIAAEAGVSKPILYRYFRHKGDLYEAIAQRFTSVISEKLRRAMRRQGHPRDILKTAIDAYVKLVETDTEIYRFLVHRGRIALPVAEGPIETFVRRLGDEIGLRLGERLREAGLDSGPAVVWGHGIVGMVSAAVDWWVDQPVLSRRRLVEFLTDLLWSGFRGLATVQTPASAPAERSPVVVKMERRR
jgi:AcrR family transcriptional regulator